MKLNVDDREYDLGEFVCDKMISSNDPAAVVRTLEPTFPGYWQARNALRRYRDFAKIDSGKQLTMPAKPIPPRGTYADMARLTQLLQLVGDLPASAAVDPVQRSTKARSWTR